MSLVFLYKSTENCYVIPTAAAKQSAKVYGMDLLFNPAYVFSPLQGNLQNWGER